VKHFKITGTMVEENDGCPTIYIRTKTETQEFIDIPEWMTPAQTEAVNRKYAQDPDGSPSLKHFYTRVKPAIGGYCSIRWCGIWLGIEKDGYTHS
jgi:hypothetical protein